MMKQKLKLKYEVLRRLREAESHQITLESAVIRADERKEYDKTWMDWHNGE